MTGGDWPPGENDDRVVRAWVRRTTELQREFGDIAEADPRWWLLAGAVAIAEPFARGEIYLACDAEPDADTFMAYRRSPPRDPVTDAISRARAARTALRELDGTLPDQPLAVTIDSSRGAACQPSGLDVAAFAIGSRCLVAKLDDPSLPACLAKAISGAEPEPWSGATPFVCVSIGDEPIERARHGHRRAWTMRGGPWLGLGRAGDLTIVSTCHLVVDGYGHALITSRIAELTAVESPSTYQNGSLPPLAGVTDAVPLAIAWRELPHGTPRLLQLAYELGRVLHRQAGKSSARFSPTIQIPVARGDRSDPMRLRRRVVSATTSVRFVDGVAEPFAEFEARVRAVFSREAAARGLVSRLLAAANAVPVPVSWKRKGISAKRPQWMEDFAAVIGGRALLSRIAMDSPVPPMIAVSSPSRLATEADPIGGCVITIVGEAHQGAITVCGSGFVGSPETVSAFLDELLASI